jgi:hypothetical protein
VTSERGVKHPARVGVIGAAITAFAFLDAYTVGLLIAALAAWLPAFDRVRRRGRRPDADQRRVLSMGRAPVGCMDRRQRQADGNGARQAAQEPTHAPSGGMDPRGSDAWFTLAAILMNPVIVIALARTIGGQPVGPRPVWLAAACYSIVFAAVFSAIGFVAGDAISAA